MDRMLRHVSRRWIQRAMARLAGAVVVMGLGLGMFSPQALAAIKDTKHNLGSTSATDNNTFSGTTEICVFCHTPHGAADTKVPLWNRTLQTTTYTTYNSLGTSSLDGGTAPVGSVSLACLSCHDGGQAMNVMINTPNSGSAALAGTWTGANQSAGAITGAMTNLGVNLQNDHPIGIQYAGGPKTGVSIPAAGAAYDNTMFKDVDFAAAPSATLNGKQVWWVDSAGGTLNTREKTDMALYTRSAQSVTYPDGTTAVLAGDQPFVECASCHDPHSTNATFLRIQNTNSNVCLACHTK